ncbi:enoyl-CoA hydratase [Prauserella sp. PE36]|uniref:Enoyl-CoA hydratase/isomerase family protein n=1 Tax=Prauserella endophytica TaxID=1592324 RepID=A0ABY2RWB4_9PSEU|nr:MULTISPECIES: enoyl-CoA hydratase/isomerase family protein [Prauserella]PXY23187.1 enoyl-CoA hydratase [Prauserella coralliicola]RBM18775.1 enoyl-CoA hydratase [Prauserella sp. PE36]TKG61867.1 enoyl-CoA hydratase/isomerase family protein [Prauserella endophytica]
MAVIDYSVYENILASRAGSVLTLTLNRPERFNAVNHELHEELSRIFTDVAVDDETSVVVLTGAGRAFCAGGDLKAFAADAEEQGRTGHYLDMGSAKRIIFSLLDLEKPIIAKVNGHALGLGATLALFCDIVYMADDARIGDPHVSAGVVAGDGGAIIWPQLVGYARAKEFLLTGDQLSATRAADMGLVNHAVPAEDLDRAVDELAARLASGAQEAIRWSKVSVNVGLKQLAHSILDTSIAYETLTMRSPAHAEAIDAFSNGRKPDFTSL